MTIVYNCQQDEKKPHTHKQSVTIAIEKNNSLSKHTPKIAKAQQKFNVTWSSADRCAWVVVHELVSLCLNLLLRRNFIKFSIIVLTNRETKRIRADL